MRRLRVLIAGLLALAVLLPAAPALAAIDVFEQNCKTGGSSASSTCQVSGADPITGSNGTIAKVTKIIARLSGAVAIILITIGGIMYITSGGDSSRVSAAKNTVLYAAIGLIVVVLAQGIIIFIVNRIK
jgi:hypothetical protein